MEGKVFQVDDVVGPEVLGRFREAAAGLLFRPSTVFDRVDGVELELPEVRTGSSVRVNDARLIDVVKRTIIGPVAEKLGLIMRLARDHVTFIHYDTGEFFDWHQDHEKYVLNRRNEWLEMHLIFGINEAAGGGEFEVKRGTDEPSQIELKAGSAVVFDKRLKHRSRPVTAGVKTILTVDVMVSWAPAIEARLAAENYGDLLQFKAGRKNLLSLFEGDFENIIQNNLLGAETPFVPLCFVQCNGNEFVYCREGCLGVYDRRVEMMNYLEDGTPTPDEWWYPFFELDYTRSVKYGSTKEEICETLKHNKYSLDYDEALMNVYNERESNRIFFSMVNFKDHIYDTTADRNIITVKSDVFDIFIKSTKRLKEALKADIKEKYGEFEPESEILTTYCNEPEGSYTKVEVNVTCHIISPEFLLELLR